jgi:hypothetical protein
MSPVLLCAGLTFALIGVAALLLGPDGPPFLVTAAGLPHFIVAFVFSLGSIRHGRPERRRTLALLGVLSIGLCALYLRFPIFDLVGAYFVIHMFRDEVYMFVSRAAARAGPAVSFGDGSTSGDTAAERTWMAGRIFMVVAIAAYAVGRVAWSSRSAAAGGLFRDARAELSGSVPLDLMIGAGVAMLILALVMAPRTAFAALHLPPETRDFLGLFVLVAFTANLRQATLFLAFFHYVSWYLFYGEKLRAREAAGGPAAGSVWSAIRNRPRPFVAAMAAVNLVSFAGLALYLARPHDWSFLAAGYDYRYFAYWTIPHVTMSFLPRR